MSDWMALTRRAGKPFYAFGKKMTKKYRVSKNVRKAVQKAVTKYAETKMVKLQNSALTATVVQASTNPSSIQLTYITQGAGATQRIGNYCYLKRLQINMYLIGANAATNQDVRFVIFKDNQPVIGTPVTWSAIFDSNSAGNEYIGTPTIANQERIKILRDLQIRWQNPGSLATTTNGQVVRRINIYFKGRGMKLSWTDNSPTNVHGPHLYYAVATNVAAPQPTISLEGIMYFKDP